MDDANTAKAEDNQRSLLKIVDGGHTLADHSFDHMSHNSKDSPQNAYTNVEQDMVCDMKTFELMKPNCYFDVTNYVSLCFISAIFWRNEYWTSFGLALVQRTKGSNEPPKLYVEQLHSNAVH